MQPLQISNSIRSARGVVAWLAMAAAVLLAGVQPAPAFVYETKLEFISTGDFNGDGQADVVLVSREKGRVRVGYALGGGIFDWSDWRESGAKSVSGVSIGKLFDVKHDSIRKSFERYLRTRSLKLTPQRARIFERAFATHEHFSAEKLYE